MEKSLPFLCVGFMPEDPKQGGSSSHSCHNCIVWQPIAADRPGVLDDGTINCYNFLEFKNENL